LYVCNWHVGLAGLDLAELQAEAAAAAKLEKQEEKERLRAKLEAKRAELELVTPRNQSLYLATQLTVI
jgi:hypothetical protein